VIATEFNSLYSDKEKSEVSKEFKDTFVSRCQWRRWRHS